MSTFKGSEYNQRQFRQMLHSLKDYEGGHITLGPLISRLEGLLGCLEQPDVNWVNEFTHYWGMLEEVYADAMCRAEQGRTKPVIAHGDLIQKAISQLKALVQAIIVEEKSDEAPEENRRRPEWENRRRPKW